MTTPIPITSAFDPSLVLRDPAERRNATGNRKLMLALTLSFPALADYPYPTWDPTQFLAWAKKSCYADSEWHAAVFVMAVWNASEARKMTAPRGAKTGRGFDVIEAMACWDSGNRAAFAAWTKDPWFA